MKKYKIIILSLFVLMLSGCSAKQIDTSTTKNRIETNQQNIPAQDKQPSIIRAEGKSRYGDIKIIPKGEEKVVQLGANSNYGKATDYSFTGDYDIVFTDNDGKQTIIVTLNNLGIIRPQNAPIELQRLTIGDTDVFYFTPEYTGSNAVLVRFFGIAKNKEAFEFKAEHNKAEDFGDKGVLSNGTTILPIENKSYPPPAIIDGNLVLTTVYNTGEGQNLQIFKVVFNIDVKDKILKFVSKERV